MTKAKTRKSQILNINTNSLPPSSCFMVTSLQILSPPRMFGLGFLCLAGQVAGRP